MRKSTIIVLIILFVALDVFLYVQRLRLLAARQKTSQAAVLPAAGNAAINGVLVGEQTESLRPIAVMVENYPDARPQSGLVDADIVYETLAEGGITRFMALYQTQEAKNIGPVRSARTYFAEIADEWGAVFAHVGGGTDALAKIKAGGYKNLNDADQYFNDRFFRRIQQRPAPHNVYTSVVKLRELISAHDYSGAATFEPWKFKDDQALTGSSTAANININFSMDDYAVKWQYDFSSSSYLRFLAGKAHKDLDSGRQIQAKNIIVQMVKTFPVESDKPLTIGMTLEGEGKAYVFEDGSAVIGTWKKAAGGKTRYFDRAGQEILLDRGQIWVEIVPNDDPERVVWK